MIYIYYLDCVTEESDIDMSTICPYCTNKSNYAKSIEDNLYNDEDRKTEFFKSARILKCIKSCCGKKFYRLITNKGAGFDLYIYLTIEEFKRLESGYNNNLALISCLPEKIRERYEEMEQVFRAMTGVVSMSAILRSTIEAYTLYKAQETNTDVKEIKTSLKKEITKLTNLSENTKKILAEVIVSETQCGIHVKEDLPDKEILTKGRLFLNYLFTKEFKIPKELELAKEKYENQIELINKELEVLENFLMDKK